MPAPMTTAEVRRAFLTFFEGQGHRQVASSSLVPANDPTLLFTNAGMNQFKDVFTGRESRDYVRATSAQKCVRAGGKHNDLDNVGFTARHHTFFEMLGNFSFGDYFKKDAIRWGLELVTGVLGLPRERLAVTVFKGEEGIPADEEAAELWVEAGMPRDRVRRLGLKDNFWAMGDVGPCGPCSEIYVYLPSGPVPEGDRPDTSESWLEIWNLVFMQFERKVAGGPLVPLPRPSIDTGAGLERTTSIVQGKSSNYDIDLFEPLLRSVEQLSGKRYAGRWDSMVDGAMRVVADHARATAFLVADGVQPSNEGRGYVLRRIMRRAIRHGEQHLDLTRVFFPEVVESVIDSMSAAYPELSEQRAFILEATRHEEESFRRTLRRGLGLIHEELRALKGSGKGVLPGEVVWDLHQTYGFPWDLTEVVAREEGFSIDKDGFDGLLRAEQERASGGSLGQETAIADAYMALSRSVPETEFLGYDGDGVTGEGKVLSILLSGQPVDIAPTGSAVELVMDRTPFYGESGGQVGDTGAIRGPGGLVVEISDAQKPAGGIVVHRGTVKVGTLSVGQVVSLEVDADRRNRIRANHSATHLLHRALKLVLGPTVNQKGSVVHPDYLRFDFSHFAPLAGEEQERVEDLVNGWIRDNELAETRVMPLGEARAAGAVALFGEKYGEKVRVVSVHSETTELCGGTHVRRSGDIGLFKITQEMSVASGVRRVVALTGAAAFRHLREEERQLKALGDLLRTAPAELPRRIEALQRRVKELEKKVEDIQLKASAGPAAAEQVQEINGIKVLTQQVDPAEVNVLRGLADRYKDQLKSAVVGLGGRTADGKALVLVAVTRDLVERGVNAGAAVRQMAEVVGGKGGGKPDFAQAGGSDPSRIPQAFERLVELVKKL